MTWNLFIDDERFPPSDGREWTIARNFNEVKNHFFLMKTMPDYISFDHDFGKTELNGYQIAQKICEWDMDKTYEFRNDFQFYVHSMNPVGKRNIEAYLKKYLELKGGTK